MKAQARHRAENRGGTVKPKGRHTRGAVRKIVVAQWNLRAGTPEAPCEKSWWRSETKGQAHARHRVENRGGTVEPKGKHTRGTVRKIVVAQWNLRAITREAPCEKSWWHSGT